MDITLKAKEFAMEKHKGQRRKGDKDKAMIIHPISVALLLKEYGFDDNLVASGYLHDTIEDTSCTIKEIEDNFGIDICNLVYYASEPDKSLSWKERKTHTINSIIDLPLRNKALICCDKISNLEDLYLQFEENGKQDFSSFNAGFDDQKWYYTNIYKSLIHKEDENLEMFKRLKEDIDNLFYKKESTLSYVEEKELSTLKRLDARKKELYHLKSLIKVKPFVVEFSGTPRTGKTTLINNLYDFFCKGGFDVSVIEEFTTSAYYKQYFTNKVKNLNIYVRNMMIACEMLDQLENKINKNKEIILIDRSIFDRMVWMYKLYLDNNMSKEHYDGFMNYYSKKINNLINLIIITYTDSLTCLKRDYSAHLSLEKRRFLNTSNVDMYNDCLFKTYDDIRDYTNFEFIDTTNITQRETSFIASNKILKLMKKEYVDDINKCYF